MEQYETFEQVTRNALEYALAAAGRELDDEQKDALMARYNDLERFPDGEEGLRRLHEGDYQMVVFSNGAPHMLEALMDGGGAAPILPRVQSASMRSRSTSLPRRSTSTSLKDWSGRSGRSGSSSQTLSMTSGQRRPECGPRGWTAPEGCSTHSVRPPRSRSVRSSSLRMLWRSGKDDRCMVGRKDLWQACS